MGSLTSRPKLPPVQQPAIITVPATPVPAPEPAPEPKSAESDAAEKDDAARRTAGLLTRSRGRLGTVLTGFRGILAQGADTGRKTLLGE